MPPISNTLQYPGLSSNPNKGGVGFTNLAPVNFGALNMNKPLSTPAPQPALAKPATTNISAQYPQAVKGLITPTPQAPQYPGLGGTPLASSNPLPSDSLSLKNPNANLQTQGFANAPQGTPAPQSSQPPQYTAATQSTPPAPMTPATVPQGTQAPATPQSQADQYQQDALQHTDFLKSIQNLIAQSNAPSEQQKQAQAEFQQFQQDYAKSIADIQGRVQPLEFQQGQAQVVQNRYANMYPYYTAALQAAQTGKGQQLGALQQAASALAPQLGQYGQTYYQPASAGQGGAIGGAGGGSFDPQTLANQLAPLVASGQMTIDAANSQMTGGVAGQNMLRQAVLAQNPKFNFNLSSSSGSTQATGQAVQAAIIPANQALDALQTAYDNLPDLAKGTIPGVGANIPWLQGLSQSVAMGAGIGRDQVSNFQGALAEARARINGVLTGIIGVDAATRQANLLLPDNMTPSEIPGKIAAAKMYMQNQLISYTQSGQQQPSNTSNVAGGGGGIYSW